MAMLGFGWTCNKSVCFVHPGSLDLFSESAGGQTAEFVCPGWSECPHGCTSLTAREALGSSSFWAILLAFFGYHLQSQLSGVLVPLSPSLLLSSPPDPLPLLL